MFLLLSYFSEMTQFYWQYYRLNGIHRIPIIIMIDQSTIQISFRKDTDIPELNKESSCNETNTAQLLRNKNLFESTLIGKKKKLKQNYNLKDILRKAKVKVLTKNFVKKLKRNSIYRPVADYLVSSDQHEYQMSHGWRQKLSTISETSGLVIGKVSLAIWSFSNILQITAMVFIFSILLAFPETSENQIFFYFKVSSIVLFIIDMFFNFITQRYESEKRLETLGQISGFYLRNGFFIDLVSILILPIEMLVGQSLTIAVSFVALIKLFINLNKFQKFEYLYINTSQKQQYYGLIKVLITNFAIGHFLSIFLNLMVMISPDDNWVTKLGIGNEEWFIKYIWGYYWGTNIMLTVGFGDISATNFYEAIILIFIETFSCITLAYNISYVGALIGSIREKNASKKKKMKTLHRMCKENEVSTQVETKLSSYVEEFYRIKETFPYDDEDEVIQFLPKTMQLDYRKESNKVLFENLGFLGNMSHKALLKLAESVTRKICHPEELIIKKGNVSDFIIVQKGELGMACRTRSKLDGKIIETIEVKDNMNPRIFSLDFIKNKACTFNVKSTNYTVLYSLSRQQFMDSLRGSEIDFQLLCVLKDRDEFIIDENNLYLCQICQNQYHNKFDCPRLHYFPLKQTVIFKNLQEVKKKKQNRKPYDRIVTQKHNIFKDHKLIKDNQKNFIKANYDDRQYEKMENLINFYQNVNIVRTLDKSNLEIPKPQDLTRSKTVRLYRNLSVLHQDKAMSMLEEILSTNTKQVTFWDLQCDEAHNFRYYFENGNPNNIAKTPNKIQWIF